MNKEELRFHAIRLLRAETEADCNELLDIYIDFMYELIKNNHDDKLNVVGDQEIKIIFQMITTKLAHIRETIKGINFGGRLKNSIIDTTVVANLIRNLYETISLFNLIFIYPNSDDEKKILYNLWVYSGLKYRQSFNSVARSPESLQKVEDEKKQLEVLVDEIKENKLYKSLTPKSKGKILTRIDQKEYKLKFEGKEVVFLQWQDLSKTCKIKPGLMDKVYAYFSQYAHPTHVSVFQYAGMFQDHDKAWKELTIFNLKNAFFLVSIFISDYITLLPNVLTTFENLPLKNQIAIDWQNIFARGEEYSINNCINKLE